MAERIVLNAELRTDMGKGASRRLRRVADKVPGIIYGGVGDAVPFTMEYRALAKVMEQEAFFSQILEFSLGGQSEQAVLRDVQRHPASERVTHLDLLRIRADRAIQVRVPVHFLNEELCVGVRQGGGAITHTLNEIEVSCLPGALPESIDVDMEHVELGTAIHLSDLPMPEGVSIVALAYGEDRDIPVVSVQIPRGGAEEDELEATEEISDEETGADTTEADDDTSDE